MDTHAPKTLEQYFTLPDTPARRSPVGKLMARVLKKNSGMGFEQARREANRLLDLAAGRKDYVIPAVLSPEEHAARTERFKQLKRKAA
jgi:hypothetical protein